MLSNCIFGKFLSETETLMEKVEEIGKKLDELRDFLEDVFLTTEECILLKELTTSLRTNASAS